MIIGDEDGWTQRRGGGGEWEGIVLVRPCSTTVTAALVSIATPSLPHALH